MVEVTHIFDPRGEAIIEFQCRDEPFAPLKEESGKRKRESEETEGDCKKIKSIETSDIAAEELPEEPPSETPSSEEPLSDISVSDVSSSGGSDAEVLAENCYRIQVSAKHLTLASAVFERFLKGDAKKETKVVEIVPSGWDLEAFLVLMNILHARPQELPTEMSWDLLAKVAVLADYYECQETVRYYAIK